MAAVAPTLRDQVPWDALVLARPADGTTLYTVVDSPIGELLLTSDGTSVTRVVMLDAGPGRAAVQEHWQADGGWFGEAKAQLRSYFAGELHRFDLPLAPLGTDFQRSVWSQLTAIPYGRTASYGDIAARVGRPGASRAVGLANGRNPIAVVIPCHRVIGSDGSLTGYGGGLERKSWLLGLEAGTPTLPV